ncbi:MAG: riboflavin biosynthesis protein RibF [Deltaproteobacteria bacterium CG23_combo_of_CG06-09_8_20_14_all_51_20]|nr:bifunctional riboflavin kinase/FAD synthetase [bacterium]OIP39181.1 MAG: riboflavin biosynthesis protein RibF [Desulfobacteraceae bacterium CG2_30_51_40]PIP45562.1 MAG: riboflavin biosynthesis protein RibF [Deltaproteobacteria bacterium CG23_combo_of_CG06-09_8_20_14_all_51_20]PIV99518.1 MAG: riboflavin biosynthesis protein RibF [Deltaproteobacteria bacterium CG17_big_fil_post_rev_8_21_14_2_50_51_6]PIY24053.1 MAG: riboflavin biosynthesis protein RibF [Deltaproteobacteria bacterium CG_4_10_14_
MRLIRNLDELEKPLINPVLTIGNFDGVHRGHLALFDMVKERAKAIRGLSAVMTFDPHPLKRLRPNDAPPMITDVRRKLELIGNASIDVILCLPFTEEFASISAEDFIQYILVKRIGVKELVVGYDYVFGNKRRGDIELLRKMGATLGFSLHVMSPVSIEGTTVSSTSVRRLVRDGELKAASILLGRYHEITGKVVKGMGRGGRLLGFPTANLTANEELIPRTGVYCGRAVAEGRVFDCVVNIGYNPTFPEGRFSIEAHLLGFDGNLVGKEISLILLERIRDEKAFKTIKELSDQIARDVEEAKALLVSKIS